MAIGQIVYNLEDYMGTGGLVSTARNNTRVTSFNNNDYENQRIDIFHSNILEGLDVSKLGIQAPPGTKFFLNGSKGDSSSKGQEIVVGRTGVYELDDGIAITSLIFDRPKKFTIDIQATNEAITNGINQMEDAKIKFDNAYKALKLSYDAANTTMTNKEFWENYDIIHDEYLNEYNAARAKYIQGVAGIYVQNHLSEDLYNIIIDYISGGE